MSINNSASALPSSTGTSTNTTGVMQAEGADSVGALTHYLPDKPLCTIEPRRSWLSIDFRELWAYRELLYFLMWRDVKVRYKQTLLGVLWVILQPLFMMVVFTLLFGRLAGIQSDGVSYPLFAYAGLLPWMFFAAAVNTAGNSVVSSAGLITKVYFPRLLVPAAAVAATLVDFAVSFAVLAGMMIFWEVDLTWNLLLLPLFIVILIMLALAFGMWMAALNVKYRDIRLALPFLLQLWFFASPIIYPLSFVPERWRWMLALNPMSGVIEGFRVALYGHKAFDWTTIAVAAVMGLILLVYATLNFRHVERRFADIV